VAAIVAEITGAVPDVRHDTGLVSAAAAAPEMLAAVVRRLDDLGIMAAELGLRLPSLDEVFLTLTGHHTDESDEDQDDDAAGLEPVGPGRAA
jgi:oleandomycin transport system ATP-binding protein